MNHVNTVWEGNASSFSVEAGGDIIITAILTVTS
jgi:hypothetical protein